MRFLCFILLLPLLAFCQELRPYSKTYSQGPLELKVELDRTAAGVEDSIALTLTAVAPKEYSVAFPDFNKGEALKWLCNYLKIDINESIAIGDSFNDESLIKNAGLGACVKSADNDIKKISKYICEKDYFEGSVKEVIDKFILN